MTLENKLNITDSTELARMEEKISKKKAVELFENEYLNQCEVGTFQMLAAIHKIGRASCRERVSSPV